MEPNHDAHAISLFLPLSQPRHTHPIGLRWWWLACCLLLAVFGAAQVRAAISSTPTSWPGGRWYPDPATYGTATQTGVPIVMDDGVTLYANIGYPANLQTGERAPGSFPVILTQNPYVFGTDPDPFFVSRGYIHIVADMRGTGRTEAPGNAPLVNDLFSPRIVQDGVALARWAAQVQGANGVVGLSGCSQLGIIQIFTAAAIGPNSPIKAIAPACAANSYETYMPGGIPSAVINLFPFAQLGGAKHFPENSANGLALLQEIMVGGPRAYNTAFWSVRATAPVAPDVVKNGIPALLWTGWNATEIDGSLYQYAIFQNTAANRPPFAPMELGQRISSRYHIVVGPGAHGQGLDRTIEMEWFDHWLKGQATGIDQIKTPMHLYELGSNRWVNTAHLPMVPVSTPFFLNAPGKLAILPALRPGQETIRWTAATDANGTLVYDAAPFAHDKTIAGVVAASLWASSSNTNMQLIATLSDVAPNGTVTAITRGGLLGSMRAPDTAKTWRDEFGQVIRPEHPFTGDTSLVPGQVQRFDIRLNPTLYAMPAGHVLRLTISTQTEPALCIAAPINPPQQCVYTAPQQATLPGGQYLIQRGLKTPSVVTVPLVDPDWLRTAWSDYTATSPTQTQALEWGPARH